MSFIFLEHPSDIKILVKAKSLKELFRESLRAMFEIISGKDLSLFKGGKEKIMREVSISSVDREVLLADFLAEALSLSEIYDEFYFDCELVEFDETFLKGFLFALPLEKKVKEIKAVTYHDLKIEKIREDHWEATLLFDI